MQDDRQDSWIEERAKQLYRPGDQAPFDAMFDAIEARLDRKPLAQRRWFESRSFWAAVTAAAACLVIGFSLGRSSYAPNVSPARVALAQPADSVSPPFDRTTTALLGETVALLHALPASDEGTRTTERFSSQATELLLTTRLLLDSPAAARDTRLRDLLQDLELVLAQVARLHDGKSKTDLELITEAVAERDIVPRIRRVAAQLATSDN